MLLPVLSCLLLVAIPSSSHKLVALRPDPELPDQPLSTISSSDSTMGPTGMGNMKGDHASNEGSFDYLSLMPHVLRTHAIHSALHDCVLPYPNPLHVINPERAKDEVIHYLHCRNIDHHTILTVSQALTSFVRLIQTHQQLPPTVKEGPMVADEEAMGPKVLVDLRNSNWAIFVGERRGHDHSGHFEAPAFLHPYLPMHKPEVHVESKGAEHSAPPGFFAKELRAGSGYPPKPERYSPFYEGMSENSDEAKHPDHLHIVGKTSQVYTGHLPKSAKHPAIPDQDLSDKKVPNSDPKGPMVRASSSKPNQEPEISKTKVKPSSQWW